MGNYIQTNHMMTSKKLKLSSETHDIFKDSTLNRLFKDQDFVDVTLACEDGQQIKGHKVVLSSSSSFFKNILLKNPHSSPLIYLKGVQLVDLQSILQFLYLGETEVKEENFTAFMAIADELKINGLFEDNVKQTQDCRVKEESPINVFEFDNDNQEEPESKEEDSNMLELTASQMSTDGKYHCDDCEYITNHKKHMQTHKLSVHEKVRYECDECTKEFSGPSSLRRHKKAKHEGVRFACDQCSQSSTTAFHLVTHKRIKHSTELTLD